MHQNVSMLRVICTGTTVTLISQAIIDVEFTHPSVQAVAVVRYAAVTCYTAWARRGAGRKPVQLSRRGRLLLIFNGCLDCFAYGLNCVGFRFCGASLALTIFAATSQTLTALLSYLLTKRRLSNTRLAAVLIVNVGLLLRAAPSGASLGTVTRGLSLSAEQLIGAVFILLASFCYSLLGASYEFFLSFEKPSPPYAEYMHFTSRIGLVASLMYQLAFVVPNWSDMIAEPLAATKVPIWGFVTIMIGFGGVYNLHNYCTAELFKKEGAVAVNLANACRSTTVSLLAAGLLCSEAKPWHCATFKTLASASIVSAGACLWAMTGPPVETTDDLQREKKKQ